MRIASLLSGGKDSMYATYLVIRNGHKIKYLITIFPEREDSWMFHHPCTELTKLQAKALGIKQIIGKTSGEKEKELEDLKKVLKKIKNEVDGIVSGAIASEYQKSRIDKICRELRLKHIAPLWHKDPERLLKEEINSGFEVIFTGVFSEGFDESWIGRKIDLQTIEELKILHEEFGVQISGEGGEFESLVLNCPLFKKKIKILSSEKIWDKKTSSGFLKVKKTILLKK